MFEHILEWARWLEGSPLGVLISSSGYLFPVCETIHVAALALVIGTISMVDLRLLGWASTQRPVTDLTRQVLPLTWTGFCLAALSGALMFVSNASHYVTVVYFQLKFLFLLLALVNMLVFHKLTCRSIASWDQARKPPIGVRAAGAVSLGCWVVIVFLGRWVGFVVD